VRAPGHLPVAWCLFPLFRSLGLVISFKLKLDVINTGYTIISLFITLCVKVDPGTHKCMHLVLVLKLGVTGYTDKRCHPLEFEFGDHIYLQVSSMKGVRHFGIKGSWLPITSVCIPSLRCMDCCPVKWSYLQSGQEFTMCFMFPNSKDV
jgi:hypothetical protein